MDWNAIAWIVALAALGTACTVAMTRPLVYQRLAYPGLWLLTTATLCAFSAAAGAMQAIEFARLAVDEHEARAMLRGIDVARPWLVAGYVLMVATGVHGLLVWLAHRVEDQSQRPRGSPLPVHRYAAEPVCPGPAAPVAPPHAGHRADPKGAPGDSTGR